MSLDDYLRELSKRAGSDLHLLDGLPVKVRITGALEIIDENTPDVGPLVDPILGERHRKAFEEVGETVGVDTTLWVLTSATDEQLFAFRFTSGPSFELREAPAALLRPLYRTLPRSFLVRDGRVVETYSGLPPLDELAAGS